MGRRTTAHVMAAMGVPLTAAGGAGANSLRTSRQAIEPKDVSEGSGALRRTMHALLPRLPEVESFRSASEAAGGWGATWVRLRPPEPGT